MPPSIRFPWHLLQQLPCTVAQIHPWDTACPPRCPEQTNSLEAMLSYHWRIPDATSSAPRWVSTLKGFPRALEQSECTGLPPSPCPPALAYLKCPFPVQTEAAVCAMGAAL